MVDDGKGGTNHEVLHLSNLNDIQLHNILMNNKIGKQNKLLKKIYYRPLLVILLPIQ